MRRRLYEYVRVLAVDLREVEQHAVRAQLLRLHAGLREHYTGGVLRYECRQVSAQLRASEFGPTVCRLQRRSDGRVRSRSRVVRYVRKLQPKLCDLRGKQRLSAELVQSTPGSELSGDPARLLLRSRLRRRAVMYRGLG